MDHREREIPHDAPLPERLREVAATMTRLIDDDGNFYPPAAVENWEGACDALRDEAHERETALAHGKSIPDRAFHRRDRALALAGLALLSVIDDKPDTTGEREPGGTRAQGGVLFDNAVSFLRKVSSLPRVEEGQ